MNLASRSSLDPLRRHVNARRLKSDLFTAANPKFD